MDKRLLTLLLVCMCATFGIQARTVKGTVVDKVNQPVIGASVHVNKRYKLRYHDRRRWQLYYQ